MCLPGTLEATDLMPLINVAWNHSFARVHHNKNAIADRGWNPYNRNILTNADVRATMAAKERNF